MKYALAVILMLCSSVSAQREPKYPPKTARTLHSDAQIARARENIRKYPAAAELARGIIKAADQWESWQDEDLRSLLTSHEVPRAFAVSASGCPVCGDKFKAVNGDYGWIIDAKQPFKIKCPVDGAVFPSEQYPDDGWGWTNPQTGEKFWFVAYYNHWMWHKHLVPGLRSLGQAYLLTGDVKYARKAAVMLRRIAEVYPAMDHAKQSRYGQLSAARGANYAGKVVNHIWETGLAQSVADAYDAVFDQIAPDDRIFIEANFLEDAIDAYFDGKIRGNFGMHQSALVHLAKVRQTGETDKWFDMLVEELNYALYNNIYRDGFPSESSPGYNSLWVSKIADYGDELQRAGRDVFANPRIKRLFDAVVDQVNVGQYTPCIGDTGSFWGDYIGANAGTFITAYRHFKDPRYLAFIAKKNPGELNFKTFDSLFEEPIDLPADSKLPPARSRLFDGFGQAILNDRADRNSVSIYYGQKHGHGHFDRLNFELFANGQVMMPDLGYPDAMNDYVPGIYTWTKSTIAHNTVTVDAQRQRGNYAGEVKIFADSPFVRVVDIEAKETYPQCSTYRRAIFMVDAGDNRSYFVDIFTVAGGKQHDYSLHGPPGDFEMIGGAWSDPRPGTLAGEAVGVGHIYDDATLAAADYKGGYRTYAGSGFQHLFNVRTLEGNEPWSAQWKHAKDPSAMLRIRILSQSDQQVFLTDAHASPGRHKQTILKYLIARRTGDNVASQFISVIEPFKETPFIKDVKQLKLARGEGAAIEVTRVDGKRDVLIYDPTCSAKLIPYLDEQHNAPVTFNTFDPQLKPLSGFAIGQTIGKVTAVLPLQSAVTGVDARAIGPHELNSLPGTTIHFRNDHHRTAHTIKSMKIEGDQYTLELADDLLVGVATIDEVEPQAIKTSTRLPFAVTYRGTTLYDELFRFSAQVKSVGEQRGGYIELAQPLPKDHNLKPGDKIWLSNVGVGDTIEIPLIRWKQQESNP